MGRKMMMIWIVLILAFFGVRGFCERADFAGALPLVEPIGSPLYLAFISAVPPGMKPPILCVTDINADGISEVIVADDFLNLVVMDGDTLRRQPLTALVGPLKFVRPGGERLRVVAMAAGDLEGDGLPDLVVVTTTGDLWVFGNHGRWGFQRAPDSPYSVPAHDIWLQDHDGDGLLDVFAAGFTEVYLLRSRGEGRLGKPEPLVGLEGHPRAGAGGQFAGTTGSFILTDQGLWFLPQGELQAQMVLDLGGERLVVADFFGTGYTDVAIGRGRRLGEVRLYPGGPEGLGEPVVLSVDHGLAWLLPGDFNGDGWPDIVAGAHSPAGFSLFYNVEGQVFSGPYRQGVQIPAMGGLPPQAAGAVVGDFTGDGIDDLALSLSLSHVAMFTATKIPGRVLQYLPGSFLLGSSDLNGDGFPDLLSSTAEGGVAGLINSGYGMFKTQPLVGPSDKGRMPYSAQLGDVTGDGRDELVVFEFAEEWVRVPQPGQPLWAAPLKRSEARVSVWDLAAKTVLWSEPLGEGIRPLLVLCDQTGDGVLDVVIGAGEKVIILSHSGDEPVRQEIPWGGPVGPLALLGDGLVAGLRVGEKTALVLLQRQQILETGITLALAPLDLISTDLNGDGNEDLAAIGWGALEEGGEARLAISVAVLLGDGHGGFALEYFSIPDWPAMALPFPYGGLVAADLNGDGKVELAAMRLPDQAGNIGGVAVIPWDEDGLGEHVLLPGCAGTKLLALDVDGDGRAELLTVAIGTPAQLCITTWR